MLTIFCSMQQEILLHINIFIVSMLTILSLQDPQFLVQLCLQLLRALSHIPGSVNTMIESHIAAAVLGSMAAYREDGTIQSFCLDILAKVATYVPASLEKVSLASRRLFCFLFFNFLFCILGWFGNREIHSNKDSSNSAVKLDAFENAMFEF